MATTDQCSGKILSMSPEMKSRGYEIEVHTLTGEKPEDHQRARGFIRVANDFLRGMRGGLRSKGEYIKNSTITALAGFLPRKDAKQFTEELLEGRHPILWFTRSEDSQSNAPYEVKWISDKIEE